MGQISEIRVNSQITIPKNIMKKLSLKKGDKVEFDIKGDSIVVKPVLIIDKAQSWFWTKKWQDEEKEVDKDIEAGRVKTFDNVNDLMNDLDK
ncbi:MAG: AbrB family transcriptional regulator [Euryarchaeota archaeon HGW-Euryarchaeota-1]|nr:MAG: AbrB family transcriptional regulator [Euryarchaeota archaeon HGW-Euryarchaeota-1]PKP55566.1 MAG: AbrB family transcriptional regulator [Candidatus Atribacteria bacterium HGW-Atribacteria-1]